MILQAAELGQLDCLHLLLLCGAQVLRGEFLVGNSQDSKILL